MGATLSSLKTPASWHVLSYGVLLGSQFYQSFIGGTMAFKALSRPAFSQLQQNIFPVYFGLQTLLPIATILTTPGIHSFAEVFQYPSRLRTGGLLLTAVSSALNWFVIGPWTTGIMRERKVQETKDGKKYYDEGPKSEAMEKLNKRFGIAHGVSSLMNMVGLIGTVGYGLVIADRMVYRP